MALRQAAGIAACAFAAAVAAPLPALADVPFVTPSVVAGGGTSTSIPAIDSGDPLPLPTGVKFHSPGHIAVTDDGTSLVIPSPFDNKIFIANFYAQPPTISKIAGGGIGYSGDDGSVGAPSALIHTPKAAAIVHPGNSAFVFTDQENNRVRQVSLLQGFAISLSAGNGTAAHVDGAATTTAEFSFPDDLSSSAGGYDVFEDRYIRRVAGGNVTTVGGSTNINDPSPKEPGDVGYPSSPTASNWGGSYISAINDTDYYSATPTQVYKVFDNGGTPAVIRVAGALTGGVAAADGGDAKTADFGGSIGGVQALGDGGFLVYVHSMSLDGAIWRVSAGGTLSKVADHLAHVSGSTEDVSMAIADSGLFVARSGLGGGGSGYGDVELFPAGQFLTTPTAASGDYTSSSTASFTYGSWDKDATFTCGVNYNLAGDPGTACGPQPFTISSINADGPYSLLVYAHTDGGTHAYAFGWTWRVDHTPPTLPPLVAPDDGAARASASTTFIWTPKTDPPNNGPGSGVDHFELWVDGSDTGKDLTPAQCSDNCEEAVNLSDGSHRWLVKSVDKVGNTTTTAERHVIVDLTPPGAAPLAAPADGAESSDLRPQLSWNAATDGGSGIGEYDVVLDGTALGLHLSPSTLSFQPPAALAEGKHTWSVIAKDAVGNATTSPARSFRVDATPPSAVLAVSPNPALAGSQVTLSAGASSDPADGHITHYEWDLDGDGSFEQDGGTNPTFTRPFTASGDFTVGVRVTDGVGLTATATASLKVNAPTGPAGQVGVTINNGAQYTRTPDVTLSIKAPVGTTQLLISNDGGFLAPTSIAPTASFAWKLDSSGPERLPKIVYVRALNGPIVLETYTDDIILDETPPKVDQAAITPAAAPAAFHAAKLATWNVKVKATDSNSGVDAVQITANNKKPGPFIKYKTKLKVRSAKRPKFIRARDRAGNFSAWRTVKRH